MKKTVQRISKCKAFWGMLALVLVLGAGLFAGDLAIVSHAESAAKVTASSAKIRKSADSSSEVIGSASKDKTISIKSQTKGADGYTWYEVYVDANTLGYIRSDLVSITDGSTPSSSSGTTTTTTTTTTATPAPAVNETPVEVTAVEPLSATVTGGQSVRVRSNASTTSQIVTTAENGMALTVTGQATGTDGKTWYQITFISNSIEVTGFIRSDYVALSGELQAPVEEQPTEEQPVEEQPEDTQTTSKDWDTQLQGDAWYLLDMAGQKQYKIEDLFNSIDQITEINAQFDTDQKKLKSQKAVIIVLVILLVFLAAAVTLLIFKIKDMMDAADFSDAEESVRRRRVDRPKTGRPAGQSSRPQGSQKVMHEVGAERRPTGQGQRSVTGQQTRPTGQGARPAGQGARPVAGQQARPAGQGARPAGQSSRPVADQQARPAGQGARPVAGQQARPAGQGARPVAGQQARPAGQGARPVAPQVDRPARPVQNGGNQDPGWKSKNFMSDDDEFEFEFLNWDGDEEQ